MSDPSRMSPAELRESGLLMEVNRRFFHPLGLALAVDAPETELLPGETPEQCWERAMNDPGLTLCVLDDRSDPEGWRYDDVNDPEIVEKAARVAALEAERRPAREAALGYWIQPLSGE